MPDFKYQRDTHRFFSLGMDLNRPGDQLKELKFKLLKNVRSYMTGRIEPRQGLTLVGTTAAGEPVHSIRRLNSPRTTLWTRIIGTGTSLAAGTSGTFPTIDTGYSGDPLALVPYRPPQDPDPWMYVMDSLRQRKVNVSSTVHQVGLPPPTEPPVVVRGAETFKVILGPTVSTAGWLASPFKNFGTVMGSGALINTTLSSIKYDTGSTGWCVIQPGSMNSLTSGLVLRLAPSTDVVVHDSYFGTINTTIQSILYIGSVASLSLNYMPSDLPANVLLLNTTRGTSTLATATMEALDGSSTIILTPPTSNWATGDSITINPTFRCYDPGTHAPYIAITSNVIGFWNATLKDEDFTNTRWINSPKFTPALNLMEISSGVASTPDSYISMRLYVDVPQDIENVRVMFGCTDTSDAEHAFDNDFFFRDFSPGEISDFKSVQRIKLSSLLSAGSPSLSNVYYIRVQTTIKQSPDPDNTTYGSNVQFGDIILIGGTGPDSGVIGADYLYRYRARVASTGVVSNWGPAIRGGLRLGGEQVTISAPSQYTLAAEADMIDFQRRGGSLPDDWFYVGSVANSASPTTFVDKYTDDVIVASPGQPGDIQLNYQLWPVIGAATSGTATLVSGNLVQGTGFNSNWVPGVVIRISGKDYTLYQSYSTTLIELIESAGYQANVTWECQEPILQGQPLPCFWGPLNETMFGCGDPTNPQRLYWTNEGDADTTQQVFWRDITTPSEPLMNGLIYNGRSYVWSSERFFQVIQADDGSWSYIELPSGKGLWGRWAFTNPQSNPGPELYYLGRDSIYRTDGGGPSDITGEDLRPLFPNEGNLGVDVNTVSFPYMVPQLASQFRLSYYDDYLYFDYVDDNSIFAIPVNLGADDMNLWDDLVKSRRLQVAIADNLNAYADTLAFTETFQGFVLSDSLVTTLADTLEVTKTP